MNKPSEKNVDEIQAATWKSRVCLEFRKQLEMAWPMIVINLISYAIVVISLMFVGHLGVLELSSAAFANSIGNITGISVMAGLGSGLETSCGQAFGAKRYHLLGKYLQASVLVLVLIAIPISVLWWNIDPLLVWLGQDPTIAQYTGLYLRALTPALFASGATQPFIKYFQTQGVVLPMMVFSVITLAIHVPVSYVLVSDSLGIGGFLGGAFAVDISYTLLLLQLVVYTWWSASRSGEERKTWHGFTAEAFGLVLPFLRLAVPSTFMLCVQFWGFEILIFLSGLLPNPEQELSFLSICTNTAGLLFTIPFGLSAVASTRVSNELGAGSKNGANLAMYVVLGLDAVQIAVIATCLLLFGRQWAMSFSDSPDVVDYTTTAMPFLALSTLFDGIQGVLSGVARGCGRQDLCAALNIASVYGVGLPMALLCGFVLHQGARGLYIGALSGLGTYTFLMLIIILRTDWSRVVEQAGARVNGPYERLLPS